ncbi:uncharacterized protein LOC131245179 [Magnolia sinica]|uniref:uncharacterized protein LOC131245179 n=1 Tax=Magnolia sinica TaxID=86752 RepID=UPI00265ADC68|nr:uncharacterized protein LOC131245179 [Magnolia sinica]
MVALLFRSWPTCGTVHQTHGPNHTNLQPRWAPRANIRRSRRKLLNISINYRRIPKPTTNFNIPFPDEEKESHSDFQFPNSENPIMTNNNKPQTGRTNLASCIVATIFLVFVAIVILIIFFTLFNPKEPRIAVNAVQLPSFSVTNGTVNFTFSQYVSVRNPNRSVFTHYDSSLQLIYAGNQVGFMFIPAGKIQGGHTQYMSATFSVESFPFAVTPAAAAVAAGGVDGLRLGPSMEIQSKLRMEGRVRILHFFTHHVEASARCRVAVSTTDGSVLGFHC